MASSYNPDASTDPSDNLYSARLSHRDLANRVPLNFVTAPGVGLSAVCFSDNRYEDAAAQKCLSNLLSVGFHRFIVDLYWDQSRQTWTLCPVELSTVGNASLPINTGAYSTSLSTSSSSTSGSASLTIARFTGDSARHRQERTPVQTPSEVYSQTRETSENDDTASLTSTSQGTDVQASGSGAASTTATNSPVATQAVNSSNATDETLQIGPYSCTTSIGISTLADVLSDYFLQTENDLNATFKYLELNLHSAASFNDPTGGADLPDPARLPGTGNYLGQLINTTLSSYIYTPYALHSERANLNESWFALDEDIQPLPEYFSTETVADGTYLHTTNGWPSTADIMLRRALRFIIGVGTVDSQMQQYNWSADVDTIFPPGYILNTVDATFSTDVGVSTGCFFQPGVTTLSAVNSSWAISNDLPNITGFNNTSNAAINLSSCGISPILNTTLSDSLAGMNGTAYLAYIKNTIWGWADDQPDDENSPDTGDVHCAVVDLRNGGRWQVTDCSDDHFGVCRDDTSPYNWSVSRNRNRYYQMDQACDPGYSFAVPRTALENSYLYSGLQAWTSNQEDDDDADTDLFWLNFNDLDNPGCWVSGVNSTCPYVARDINMTRKVIVPTVAAIIVFFLAILTILVKCAANRRNTRRRRRRGDGGWDYEGVPS